MAVESNISLIVDPWINDGPCTHESLGTVSSLLMPTNESYFPVQKKKKKKKVIKKPINIITVFTSSLSDQSFFNFL